MALVCLCAALERVLAECDESVRHVDDDLLIVLHGAEYALILAGRPLAPDIPIEVSLGHRLTLAQHGNDALLDLAVVGNAPRRKNLLDAIPHPLTQRDRWLEVLEPDLARAVAHRVAERPFVDHERMPDLHVVGELVDLFLLAHKPIVPPPRRVRAQAQDRTLAVRADRVVELEEILTRGSLVDFRGCRRLALGIPREKAVPVAEP